MMRRFILLTLMLSVCVAPPRAAGAPLRPLVLLLLPGTSLRDWRAADAPTLHQVLATGSLAVMNTRSARLPSDHTRESPESAALTLGAGSRAAGGVEVTDFHPASERVPGSSVSYGSLYARRTGTFPRPGALVDAEWPRVQRENSGQSYDLRPGNLADGLVRHGVPVCAGGGRFAWPVSCDGAGTVQAVWGGQQLPRTLPPFLVWDAGPNIAAADAVIRQAVSEVAARQGRLVIVSPFVSDGACSRGERLAPVVVWGPGVPPGLLFSPSTHRAGLVTNTDMAPSVSGFFGATPRRPWLRVAALGRPWEWRAQGGGTAAVARLEADAYRQASAMRLLPAVAVCLGLLTLSRMICSRRGLRPRPLLWLPGVLVLALLVSATRTGLGLWIAALCLLCWGLQSRLDVRRLLFVLASGTVSVLIADTVTGSTLMRRDLLGYSAVEGARYYGIGNEAMGALVGSALVVADAVWRRGHSRVPVALCLGGIALLLGLPAGGAKAGGLLVAVAAFGAFLWTASGKRWDSKVVLGLAGVTVLALALVALADWHHASREQSHLGGTLQRITTGGFGEVTDIVRRKLAVEGHLAYHSTWAMPLWTSLLGLAFSVRRLSRGKGRSARALIYGSAAAALVCLAANDAGVVAASLCGAVTLSGIETSQTEKSLRRTAVLSGGGFQSRG